MRKDPRWRVLFYEKRKWIVSIAIVIGMIAVIKSRNDSAGADREQGTVSVILTNTSIDYISTAERPAAKGMAIINKKYRLNGTNGVTPCQFVIYDSELSEQMRKQIEEQSPEVTVIYYEQTREVVQLQIVQEDGSVMISGAEDENAQVLEPDNAKNPSGYKEITLEEAGMEGIEVGDSVSDASKVINSYWFQLEMLMPDNMHAYQAKKEAIATDYGMTEAQNCSVYTKQNVEVVLIYNKDTMVVEQIVVREVISE